MAIDELYAEDIAPAYEGQVADLGLAVIISRTIEDAAGIGFGKPVKQGATERGITGTVSGTLDIVGLTVRNVALVVDGVNTDKYLQREGVPVMRSGVMWVKVTDAGGVVAGDPVWMARATGLLSNADAGSGGSIRLAGARWESNGANNALARVRVDFDVPNIAGA